MDANFGNPGNTSNFANPYLFTGRRLDILDSGSLTIYYYRARNYDADTGRFLQHDPKGYVDGMNLYEYVSSNPMIYVDPMGRFSANPYLFGSPFGDGLMHGLWEDIMGLFSDGHAEGNEWVQHPPKRIFGSDDGFLDKIIDTIKEKAILEDKFSAEHIIAVIPPFMSIKAGFEVACSRKKCCHREGLKKGEIGEMVGASIELFAKVEAGATVRFVKHSRGELRDIFGGRYKPQNVLDGNKFVGGMGRWMTGSAASVSIKPFADLPDCKTELDGQVGLEGYGGATIGAGIVGTFPIGSCSFSEGCSWDFKDSRVGFEVNGEVSLVLGLKAYGSGSGTVIID